MSENQFTPLPDEVIARGDLTPRAMLAAWLRLQPPDGITQAEAARRLGFSVNVLVRAVAGGNLERSTLLTLGRATGLWDWGFTDPGMAATARGLAGLEAAS